MPRGRHKGKAEGYWARQWGCVTPQLRRLPREQIVIQTVMTMCRAKHDLPETDDLASDIIMKLWQNGGFAWELDRIRAYVAAHVRYVWITHISRKTKNASEFGDDDDFDIFNHAPAASTQPTQETFVMAGEALRLAYALPNNQRDCLLILADGGSPLDVAVEMGIEPWAAIHLIKEARANIHRVDAAEAA